jgi:hypothetical protein
MSLPGGPSHSSPDTAMLVSRTSRTSLLGPIGVNFGLDLFGRHRSWRRIADPCPGLGKAGKPKSAQALSQQLLQRLGFQQSFAGGFACQVVGQEYFKVRHVWDGIAVGLPLAYQPSASVGAFRQKGSRSVPRMVRGPDGPGSPFS